ncbi:MAG: HAD-IA family hydrolase [Candidatus Methylomirabilales bacterium]
MSILRLVIFDVDGTLAETERDGHRVAFNRAFERLGLPDRWDEDFYGDLLRVTGGRERLYLYFDRYRPLPGTERDQLVEELHRLKNEAFRRLIDESFMAPRSGILRLLDALHHQGLTTAVATTGSRSWVEPLLEGLFGRDRLSRIALIITGEDVTRKKPDPEVYTLTISKLGSSPQEALAIEDSQNGLDAAKGAGLPCVITRSSYSRGDDFSQADLVLEDLGAPGAPCRVLSNAHPIDVGDVIDVETLLRLHHRATASRDAS